MAQEPTWKPPTIHITGWNSKSWVIQVARMPSYLLAGAETPSLQVWTPGTVSSETRPPAHLGSHRALCPGFSGMLSLLLHPWDIPLWSVNQVPREKERLITHKNYTYGVRALTTWPYTSPSALHPLYQLVGIATQPAHLPGHPLPCPKPSFRTSQAHFLPAGPPWTGHTL